MPCIPRVYGSSPGPDGRFGSSLDQRYSSFHICCRRVHSHFRSCRIKWACYDHIHQQLAGRRKTVARSHHSGGSHEVAPCSDGSLCGICRLHAHGNCDGHRGRGSEAPGHGRHRRANFKHFAHSNGLACTVRSHRRSKSTQRTKATKNLTFDCSLCSNSDEFLSVNKREIFWGRR